jgi:hypothetical protein
MTKVSALKIMMWSQLGNEIGEGRQRDHAYDSASYSNSIADIRRRIRCWIRSAYLALAQTSRAALDVLAVHRWIARYHVRACAACLLSFAAHIEATRDRRASARAMMR